MSKAITAKRIDEIIYTQSRDLIIKLKNKKKIVIRRGEKAKMMYRRLAERDNKSELG